MNRWVFKAAAILLLVALTTACTSGSQGNAGQHTTECPTPSRYRMPSVPALLYVQPISRQGCNEAVDWSGRVLGPIPAPPGCTEACHVASASPDGKVLDNWGQIIPEGAAKGFDSGWVSAVWSPDSRYVCGFSVLPSVALTWRSASGPAGQAIIHSPSPLIFDGVDVCDPAGDRAILSGGLPNRAVIGLVRLSTGAVIRQWSFPTSPGNSATGLPAIGVHIVFSLNGAVMAETPFTGAHATGRPALLSTETGRVIARLPVGYLIALNAPGTMALFEPEAGNAATVPGPIEAIHAPWTAGHVVASGVGSTIAEPGGNRLAFDAGNEVIILGGQGQLLARLTGERIMAPIGVP